MEDLRRRAGRFGLQIILVNVWEGAAAQEEATRFCDIWGVDGPVLMDEDAAYTRALGIRGVPTNVIVGADGIVRSVGSAKPEALLAAVESLIGQPLPPDSGETRQWTPL